jgi:hypothetical protein
MFTTAGIRALLGNHQPDRWCLYAGGWKEISHNSLLDLADGTNQMDAPYSCPRGSAAMSQAVVAFSEDRSDQEPAVRTDLGSMTNSTSSTYQIR